MILRKFSMAFACLAMSACSLASAPYIPASPSEIANQTALDEQTALSVELAYQAAGLAVRTAVDAGIVKGETAENIATLDGKAYGAVRAVRSAYDAGNAESYAAAADIARSSVAAIVAEVILAKAR